MLTHWVKLAMPSFQESIAPVMLDLRLTERQRTSVSDDDPVGILSGANAVVLDLAGIRQVDEVQVAVSSTT